MLRAVEIGGAELRPAALRARKVPGWASRLVVLMEGVGAPRGAQMLESGIYVKRARSQGDKRSVEDLQMLFLQEHGIDFGLPAWPSVAPGRGLHAAPHPASNALLGS